MRGEGAGSAGTAYDTMTPERWRTLFREAAAGRDQAFEELLDATSKRLYGLALWRTGSHEDASEVVQEVFVRLMEQGTRLTRVSDPRSWLLAVTRRVAIDVVRRRKTRTALSLDGAPLLLVAPELDPGRGVDAERASHLLVQLPPRQRDVIYLRHFAGCTFTEIGKITGTTRFTAASRYRLGIRKLRSLMEKER